jgi:CelD/BcsL family acetyltransferase involved in cellulose biosynthesis
VLYLDQHPCAFWIGSLHNGTFLSDYLAFDPDYAQYVPGTYLTLKVMEKLYEADMGAVKRVDFGIGDAIYKERLANDHWDESLVYIFAPNPKGVGVNALRSAVGLVDGSARFLMRMTPLLNLVKRTWRTRATPRN